MAEPLLKKIQDKKTLDEIGTSLCGDSVKNPRQKAIRLIRELLGEETLIQYAETLKYDVEKAKLGKKPKSLRKIKTDADGESKKSQDGNQHVKISFDDIVEKLMELVKLTSISTVKSAIERIEHQSL